MALVPLAGEKIFSSAEASLRHRLSLSSFFVPRHGPNKKEEEKKTIRDQGIVESEDTCLPLALVGKVHYLCRILRFRIFS